MKTSTILCASMTVFILAATQVKVEAAAAHKTLKVKLNYTGAGTVDKDHKIYVLVFDANPYTAWKLVDSTSDATPPAPAEGVSHILRRQSAVGKNETVTFDDLIVSPVYAAAFFDEKGGYDGHSDLVSGAPTGPYGKAPDKAEPIRLEEGKSVEVVLAFDDSVRTP